MEDMNHSTSLDTLCSHAGIGVGDGSPLEIPIVQSTAFCRDQIDSDAPHAYSRVSNPTVSALERTLGELESEPPAVCFASGLAAETALFLTLLSQGDHVVCGRAVYGGTTRLLQNVLARMGVETTLVDATRPDAVRAAVHDRTRLVFAETPSNPTLVLTDLAAVADIAHRVGALLAVDNTFMTAVLQQPLDWGADVSLYSTTKFVEGHSVALGGALVAKDERLLERLRFIRKSTGGIQTPFNAWLTLHGLKTLPLRIRHQSETAARVAHWLQQQPEVCRVLHPTLETFPQRELAERQHRSHHGAVVSFELDGGLQAAQRMLKHVRLFRLVEQVGGVETLLTHSATMTHVDVPIDQRRQNGISDGLLRLSVGLEDTQAIIDELEHAIKSARPQVTTVRKDRECATVS